MYAEQKKLPQAPALHPLQQAFIDEQAPHCGYCYNGMTIKGLGAAGAESAPDRSANPHPHGRPSLPLRHLSARHEGDPARVHAGWRERRDDRHFTAICIVLRRDLLKGGGALIVGFSLAGALPDAAAAALGDTAGPPDPKPIDTWIAIHADNTATIYFGKCELGQGNTTGLLQIAGEELDLDMSQLTAVRLDTNVTPEPGRDQLELVDRARRPAIARGGRGSAPGACCALAATRLGVQIGSLTVSKGVVFDRRRAEPLGQIRRPARRQAVQVKFTGTAPLKPPSRYTLVGTRVPRVDLPDKVGGKYMHMQHVRVPDMLHGRVVLPRGQRAYGAGAKPLAIDESSIKAHSGRARGAQGRFRRRGRRARMGCRQGRARPQGDLAGERRRCPAMPTCTSACAPPRPRIP